MMFIFLFILIILIFLLSTPIPVKLKIVYKNGQFTVYIYNMKLSKTTLKGRKKDKGKTNLTNLLNTFLSLKNNKLKPVIKLDVNFTYGFDDPAYTAIVYGLICSSYRIFTDILSSMFKIKKYHIHVLPSMNKVICDFQLNSIIFINLVKIIYIQFIIHKNLNLNRASN